MMTVNNSKLAIKLQNVVQRSCNVAKSSARSHASLFHARRIMRCASRFPSKRSRQQGTRGKYCRPVSVDANDGVEAETEQGHKKDHEDGQTLIKDIKEEASKNLQWVRIQTIRRKRFGACEVWGVLTGPKLRDDETPEALALMRALKVLREEIPGVSDREKHLAQDSYLNLTTTYWGARIRRITNSPAVKRLVPGINFAVNLVVLGLVVRVALPRMLALNAGDGVYDLAQEYGLPEKHVLEGYIDQLQALPLGVRFAAFASFYIFERLTLTTEFLPIGFVLPFLSPVVFGGVWRGALLTSLAATLGSSVTFQLGKTVLKDKVADFRFRDQPPLSSASWFKAIYRRFDSEQFPNEFPSQGFKSALLIRLAPVLPVPVDAHWYILGTTNLKLAEFALAHLMGVFKVALLDAFLGQATFQAVTDSAEVQQQAQYFLFLETGVVVVISLVESYVVPALKFYGYVPPRGIRQRNNRLNKVSSDKSIIEWRVPDIGDQ